MSMKRLTIRPWAYRLCSFVLFLVYSLNGGLTNVQAATDLQMFNKGIFYYSPEAVGCGTGTPTSTEADPASLSDATVAQKIASTFIVGFDASTSKKVITDIAAKYRIGGIYLIGTNDAAKAGFDKDFYASLDKAAGTPLLVASDEEGVVTRYKYGSTDFPSAAAMARMSNSAVTDVGKSVGAIMAKRGITTDLAPVLDLRDVGSGLDGRSFSDKPAVVTEKAGAFASGLKAANVKPIFKHFPGFDDTTKGSTDDEKVVMKGSISKTTEPYRKLLAQNTNSGLMLSNMYVNALDKDNPSSLSVATMKYVRSDLKFNGLVTTDDLAVKSVISKAGSLANAVTTALQAGVTMPLFTLKVSTTTEATTAMDAILKAAQSNSAVVSSLGSKSTIIQDFKSINTATQTQGSSACCSISGSLAGSGNKAKIWNFFIGKGLSATATAGIMGNWQAESKFDPSIQQNEGAWEDLSGRNINMGGKGGVGLSQWDGDRRPKIIKYLAKQGLTGDGLHKASDKLLLAELNYVWSVEFNDSYKSTLTAIKAASSAGDAAYQFHKIYEGSSDTEAQVKSGRMDPAQKIYEEFSGSAKTAIASSDTGSGESSGSCAATPDCASASGSAKILCAAKAYDTASYLLNAAPRSAKAWHKQCTTIGPSCKIDCSLLVTLAVFDAFKEDIPGNTHSEKADTKNWKIIPLKDVQPGDIMQPHAEHVEIVDHVSGNTVYTFGAHTDEVPQKDQVNPSSYKYNSGMVFLHYKGADN